MSRKLCGRCGHKKALHGPQQGSCSACSCLEFHTDIRVFDFNKYPLNIGDHVKSAPGEERKTGFVVKRHNQNRVSVQHDDTKHIWRGAAKLWVYDDV